MAGSIGPKVVSSWWGRVWRPQVVLDVECFRGFKVSGMIFWGRAV
jgi:hypothetical protein